MDIPPTHSQIGGEQPCLPPLGTRCWASNLGASKLFPVSPGVCFCGVGSRDPCSWTAALRPSLSGLFPTFHSVSPERPRSEFALASPGAGLGTHFPVDGADSGGQLS